MHKIRRNVIFIIFEKTEECTNTTTSVANTFGTLKRIILVLFIISPFRNPSQIKPSDHFRLRRCMPNDRRFILVIAFSFIGTYCHPNRLRIFVV